MCNINLAYRKDKKADENLSQFMNFASWQSFQRNKDGEGFFSLSKEGGLMYAKGKRKFRFDDLAGYFLCSHQRLSTSGFGAGMEHPHETKDLLVVHNGIFTGLGDRDKSDTSVYADMLQAEYEKCDGNIVEAIQKTNKEVSGSFSVVVYDKITEKVYYFKESCTQMYKAENEQYLIMSTNRDNVEFAQFFFNISGDIKSIKPYRIIDILNGWQKVGKFKEKVYTTANKSTWGEKKDTYNIYKGWDNTLDGGISKYVYDKEDGRWVHADVLAKRQRDEWDDWKGGRGGAY